MERGGLLLPGVLLAAAMHFELEQKLYGKVVLVAFW
jgi:hypothetical protein